MKPKSFTLFFALLLIVLMNSCYTARIESHAQAGSEVSGQTVNFFFWGAIQSPKRILTPICDSLGANGMAEVTVRNNLGYSLITVVTLGIWSPTRVEWKCGKPCQKVGTL
jgi:Bor protein